MDGRKVNPVLLAVTVLAIAFGVYGMFFSGSAPPPPAANVAEHAARLTPQAAPSPDDPNRQATADVPKPVRDTPEAGADASRDTPASSAPAQSPPHGDGVIEGTVLGPDGQPLPGTEVLAVREQDVHEGWREGAVVQAGRGGNKTAPGVPAARIGRSGPDGSFRVTGIGADTPYWVVATDALLGEVRVQRVVAGQRVVLQFSPVEITSGTVTDKAGKPLACRVMVRYRHSFERSSAPQKPGHFFVRWDGNFAMQARIECDGYVPSQVLGAEHRGRTDMAIVLEPAPRLSGTVVSAVGTLVPGAEVSVQRIDDPEAQPDTARTDALGRFAFTTLRPGGYRVSVQSGAAIGSQTEIELSKDLALQLTLDTGPVITLRVRDARGRPVSGLDLTCRDTSGESLDFIDYAGANPGEHCITALPQTPFVLEIEAPRFATQWIDLAGGGQDRLIEVTMQPAARLAGRVLDIAGNGVPFAVIRFRPQGYVNGDREIEVYAQTDGRYGVDELAPGAWSVTVARDYQAEDALKEDLVLAEGGNEHNFSLTDESVLTIQLLPEDLVWGNWARVWVYAEGEDEPAQKWISSRLKSRNIALKPGTYYISLSTDRYATRGREVRIAQGRNEVSLTLREPDAVRLAWVESGTDLSRAGFVAGDIVLTYNGHEVREKADLNRLAEAAGDREQVEVVVQRGKLRVTVRCSPAARLSWTYPARRD